MLALLHSIIQPPLRRWLILLSVMLAFLPIVIDITILHIAVPSLTLALQATGTEVLWIIDIYPLFMAGLLIPMGTLADHIGNRKLFLTGLTLFTLASLMAAFSPTAMMLIASRIMLAFGGSMIMPCILGTIRRTFEDPRERAMALGLWGSVGAAASAIGPLLGGILLEYFWWGSIFLINIPIMLIVIACIYYIVPNTEILSQKPWNFFSALLLIGAILAMIYAFKSSSTGQTSLFISLFVFSIGLCAFALFLYQQFTSPTPLLDVSLFKQPAILAAITMAIVVSAVIMGVELTLVQELQYVIGKTPLQAAFFILPLMVASTIGGPIAGIFTSLFTLRTIATLSLLLAALSLLILAQIEFNQPNLLIPISFALLGFTLAMGLTASSVAIMNTAKPEQSSTAGSLEATSYELGSGLGITIFGVFLSIIFKNLVIIPDTIPEGLAKQATNSISDSFVVAQILGGEQAENLIAASKNAFSAAHSILLTTAAALIAFLALFVFFLLKNTVKNNSTHNPINRSS